MIHSPLTPKSPRPSHKEIRPTPPLWERPNVLIALLCAVYLNGYLVANGIFPSQMGFFSVFLTILIAIFSFLLPLFKEKRYRPPSPKLLIFSFVASWFWVFLSFNSYPDYLHTGVFFGGLIAYYYAFCGAFFGAEVCNRLVLLTVLPIFLFFYITGTSDESLGSQLSLFPSLGSGQLRVHIGFPGSTLHLTAALGLFLFLLNLFKDTPPQKSNFWGRRRLFCALGAYLVVFSGSRSYLLCLFIMLLARLVLHRYTQRKALAFTAVVLGVTFYSLFRLSQQKVELTLGIPQIDSLMKTTYDHFDFTSGRAWLWRYHWDLFRLNPVFGVGDSAHELDFVQGETFGRELTRASSESFFTRELAAYGLGGLLFVLPFLWFLLKGIRSNNPITFLLALALALTTVLNSTYGSTYGFVQFLGYTLFFSRIPKNSRPASPPSIRYG